MKTPLKEGHASTLDFIRDSSTENISHSFHYPANKKRSIQYSGLKNMSSTSYLNYEKFEAKQKKLRTKSFIGNYEKESQSKKRSVCNKPRVSKHARHRSDGCHLPLSKASYLKYIKNPNKQLKFSKSRPRGDSKAESYDESDDSNLISSVQVVASKQPKYFGKKKTSCMSDMRTIMTGKSTSITLLKKRKTVHHTDVPNSPVLSSTDSLRRTSKSKIKHKKQLSKHSGIKSEKSFGILANKFGEFSKDSIFKRRKRTMIARFGKKYTSLTKPNSPKHNKSQKSKITHGNYTRQVSSHRISTIGEDNEDPEIENIKVQQATGVGDETHAQVPSQFNVKKSFLHDRNLAEAEDLSPILAKSNFGNYKEAQLKPQICKSSVFNPHTQKKLNFEKIVELSKGHDYNKTEFIIPKHIGRKISGDKDSLSKYLKDNVNVQSHTIHINELLNTGSKDSSVTYHKKSPSISTVSSLTRPKRHKRVKSHHMINTLKESSKVLDKIKKGLVPLTSEIRGTSQTLRAVDDVNTSPGKLISKKHNPYLMKKSSKGFAKKNSLANPKYTVLKSKKHTQGYIHTKHKSENVTPKKLKNKKLYDYQCASYQISHLESKPKITMNVSIDLSQNKKQNIIFVDKNYDASVPTSHYQSKKKSHRASPIMEEDDENEITTFKNKTSRKKSINTTKNSKASGRLKEEELHFIHEGKETRRKSHTNKATIELGASQYNKSGQKAPENSLLNQYNRMAVEEENKKSHRSTYKKPVNVVQKQHPRPREYSKIHEEQKYFDTQERESIEGEIHKLPVFHSDKLLPHAEGCVPSIPPKSERCETFETDISALNLSPRSKAAMKLKKLIRMTFKRTGKAPDSTSEFYRVGKILGRGAFGKVNLTIHRLTEEMVAIKSINKEFLTDDASRTKVMKEVTILKKMRHKNIVQLLDTFETDKHIIFVMELCSGGDLLNYVRKRRKLSEDYAKAMFKQILEALHYCHNLNILHRDIKLDNIILDSEGVIKIGDFGVSKIIDPKQTMYDQCGTPAYIAPEILRDKGYKGCGIDVWSSGVVLYAMLYGTVPFRAQNMGDLHDMIVKAKYTLKPDISETARDLLKKILEPDPRKRLTIPEIFLHPWFLDVKSELEMFTELEKEKIRQEFSYNDVRKFNRNHEGDISVDFTEHHLETVDNDELRNLTTKSVILAPFNSTTSDLPSVQAKEIDKMLRSRRAIRFNAKCRDFNRQYEMNNN